MVFLYVLVGQFRRSFKLTHPLKRLFHYTTIHYTQKSKTNHYRFLIATYQMHTNTLNMTDRQIVTALLQRDKEITRTFFYIKCFPLFNAIFEHYYTDCSSCLEFINEIYIQIMSPQDVTGLCKLENFRFESSLYTWIKTVCLFYCYARFEQKQRMPIDNNNEPTDRNIPIQESIQIDLTSINHNDINVILQLMPNARYRELIRLRYLEGFSNEATAQRLGMTMDNYYNKHKLAKEQYLQVWKKENHNE